MSLAFLPVIAGVAEGVYPFARGVLVRFDAPASELILKTPTNEFSCFLMPKTYIFRGEEKLTADKLKPGDYLKLRIATDSPTNHLNVIRIKVDTNGPPTETE